MNIFSTYKREFYADETGRIVWNYLIFDRINVVINACFS